MPPGFKMRPQFHQAAAVISEIAESERHGDQIERRVGHGKLQRVGFKKRRAAFAPRHHKHGMAKIAAENFYRSRPRDWSASVKSPVPQHTSNTRAPGRSRICATRDTVRARQIAVDIHRQQVIQQVVARSNASKHTAHPCRGLLFRFRSSRRRSLT